MKLLDKKTLATEKSLEKKKDIDEGIKLARKIDDLRQKRLQEESGLSKFRDEASKTIQSEIDLLILKRNSLELEVSGLNSYKDTALIEVELGKKSIKQARNDIQDERELLNQRTIYLNQLQETTVQSSKELEIEKDRIESIKTDVIDKQNKASALKNSAQKLLEDSQSKCGIMHSLLDQREKALALLEKGLAFREVDLINKTKLLDMRDIAQNNRERAINDKYQTLLRTEKRLSK